MDATLAAWISSIAATLIAIFTFFNLKFSRELIDATKNPYVIVELVHNSDKASMIDCVIKNVGNAPARDITFHSDSKMYFRMSGFSKEKQDSGEELREGPIIRGIKFLGPGEKRSFYFGQYGGIVSRYGEEPIEIVASFRFEEGEFREVISYLDIRSFSWTDGSPSIASEQTKQLKKIHEAIRALASK